MVSRKDENDNRINNKHYKDNMRVLTFLTFLIAIVFMVGLDIVMFMENPWYGIGGIIGIVGFFVAYSISGDMIVAPRDYWRLSSWEVFKKKFGYGFTAFMLVAVIASAVLGAIFT